MEKITEIPLEYVEMHKNIYAGLIIGGEGAEKALNRANEVIQYYIDCVVG